MVVDVDSPLAPGQANQGLGPGNVVNVVVGRQAWRVSDDIETSKTKRREGYCGEACFRSLGWMGGATGLGRREQALRRGLGMLGR